MDSLHGWNKLLGDVKARCLQVGDDDRRTTSSVGSEKSDQTNRSSTADDCQ